MKRDALIRQIRKAKGKALCIGIGNGHDLHYVQAVKNDVIGMLERHFPGDDPETWFALSEGQYVCFFEKEDNTGY